MPFDAARVMGVPPQSLDQYFEPSPAQDFGISGFQAQPFAPVMAAPTYDPIQEQYADQQFQAEQLKHQAQADVMGGGVDWSAPEGRSKLQEYLTKGVISPQQARAMVYTIPKEHAINKYSAVPLEVAGAVSHLNQIDPSDPNAMSQLRGIVSNPDIAPVDVQTHPNFVNTFNSLKKEILSHKQHQEISGRKNSDEALIGDAISKGGMSPEEIAPYLDETRQRVVDPTGLKYATSRAAHLPNVPAADLKKLQELAVAAQTHLGNEPNDIERQAYMQMHGIEPSRATPEQIAAANAAIQTGPSKAYGDYYELLRNQKYRNLPARWQPPQTSQQGQPQAYHAANMSREQIEALPIGTPITMPDGSIKYRK